MRGQKDFEVTFGVLVANRGFFPDKLVEEGRKKVLGRLDELGYETVTLSEEETDYGAVETREDAKKCGRLFDENEEEIEKFAGVCRIVGGVKGARLGSIGARTGDFNTVRYSEKILERHGVSVETVDLSEILGQAEALDESSGEVERSLREIKNYTSTDSIPDDSLVKIAKLKWVLENWVEENELDATAVQCWSALEEYYGVVPCTAMSMMGEKLFPSACEVDVMVKTNQGESEPATCALRILLARRGNRHLKSNQPAADTLGLPLMIRANLGRAPDSSSR